MSRLTLSIDGMSCDHCVRAVRKALESVPGVTVEEVTVGRAVVKATEPSAVGRLKAAIEDEGYQVRELAGAG
jgi:copper chaperone